MPKTCTVCGQAADPYEGQCEFCGQLLCFRHTIRTTFYGEWVSWCAGCYTCYEAEYEDEMRGGTADA